MSPREAATRTTLGVVFLAVYLAATHVGLLLRVDFGGLTPLWPASGIALVLVLKFGLSWWPLIVVGETLTAWFLDQPLTMGLAGGAAQTVEAILAVALLGRVRSHPWFRNVPETVHYCVVVCLVPPLVSAGIGTLAQYTHGLIAPGGWRTAWFTWWLGDAMGLLIVAPFFMNWWRWPFRSTRRALEWLAVSSLLILTGLAVTHLLGDHGDLLFFLLLPFVAWLALGFRAAGASSAAVILAALVFGVGGGTDDAYRTAVYIAFVGASAYTGYVLAAVLTRERSLRRQLKYRADHDSVTGVFNRARLEAELNALIGRSARDEHHALIYLDLDHFKLVNETCGHETGDRLLRDLAGRLEALVPDDVILARLGGDEFAILVRDADAVDAAELAEEIRASVLDYRFESGEFSFALGVSIGIAHFGAGESAAAVLSRADIACYEAKDEGRDRVHVYRTHDLAMRRHHSELEWASQFQRAMAENQLVLFGQ